MPSNFRRVFCYPEHMSQTISVVIIAHNEERYIHQCLTSVVKQQLKPLEILLVAHNCMDQTVKIAKQFPTVTILEYSGPSGIAYARAHGFAQAQGDIVVSLDGDSFAISSNWLSALTKPLRHKSVVLTGGPVWFVGNLYGWLMSLNFFFIKPLVDANYRFYPWGSNLAFRKPDYVQAGGLKPLLDNCIKWQLTFWADDYFLYKQLGPMGKTKFVSNAHVASHPPKLTIAQWQKRSRTQGIDKDKLDKIYGT